MAKSLDIQARLGGEFIHPGARDLTEVLLYRVPLQPFDRVLEIGGGIGATAVLLAQRTGAHVSQQRPCSPPDAGARRKLGVGIGCAAICATPLCCGKCGGPSDRTVDTGRCSPIWNVSFSRRGNRHEA